MIELISALHMATITATFVLPALALSLAQGRTARAALAALDEQPGSQAALRKNLMLGTALNETALILSGLVTAMLMMRALPATLDHALATLGIFCAVGIPCAAIALLGTKPHQAALLATARQPFFAKEILRLMFITISIMQTSGILGLLISFLIQFQLDTISSQTHALALLAGGLTFGLGTIGPLIGLAHFAQAACTTIGFNRAIYPKLVTFTLVSQALIETPVLFSLAVAIIILTTAPLSSSVTILTSAVAMGVSTLGPGIASGRIAHAACYAMGKQPDHAQFISRTSMLAQTLLDACPIYGLIVAFALLFFV